MGERKESSRNITLSGVIMWLVKSGVGAAAGAAIVIALMGIGSTWRDVALQREHLSAHEESHKAEMERIDEKNAAQDKNHEESHKAEMERIDEKNAAQDKNLADYGKTQAKILAGLERNEKALTRLENKVDKMDDFLRDFLRGFMQDSRNSASLDEEGPAKNVSASLCM